MSVRPHEALEAGQRFSLRDVVAASQPAAPLAAPVSAPSGLKFSLDGLRPPAQAASPPAAAPAAAAARAAALKIRMEGAPASAPLAAGQAAAPAQPPLSLQAEPPRRPKLPGGSLFAKPAAIDHCKQQDVMRLTAFADDLSQRLQRAQYKLDVTEQQLARTSQALCAERQSNTLKMQGLKQDLAAAHETEAKLRSELSLRPAKSRLNESAFMASVGSVLAEESKVEQHSHRVAELETKVKALAEMKVSLEAEVAELKQVRDAAEREAMALREEASILRGQASETRAQMVEWEGRLESAKRSTDEAAATAACAVDEAARAVSAAAARKEQAAEAMKNAVRLERRAAERIKAAEQTIELHPEPTSAAAAAPDPRPREEGAPPPAPALAPVEAPSVPDALFSIGDSAEQSLRGSPVPDQTAAPEAPFVDLMSLDAPGPRTNSLLDAMVPGRPGSAEPASEQAAGAELAADVERDALQPERVELALPPPTPFARHEPARSWSEVRGAEAPRTAIGAAALSKAGQLAMRPMSARAVAMHLALDCPADFALQSTGAFFASGNATESHQDPAARMVNAVVGDLKQKLTELSSARPLAPTVAPLV